MTRCSTLIQRVEMAILRFPFLSSGLKKMHSPTEVPLNLPCLSLSWPPEKLCPGLDTQGKKAKERTSGKLPRKRSCLILATHPARSFIARAAFSVPILARTPGRSIPFPPPLTSWWKRGEAGLVTTRAHNRPTAPCKTLFQGYARNSSRTLEITLVGASWSSSSGEPGTICKPGLELG